MPPKLGSKKSRTGCFRCRERRIKCDEQRPKCNNCSRHDMTCVFPSGAPNAQASSTWNQNPHQMDDGPSIYPPAGSQIVEISCGPSDLQLMYHYARHTCLAYSPRDEMQHIWINVIPELAFNYDYLMEGILALSALHMTVRAKEPQLALYETARRHITTATALARPHLANMTEEHSHPLFAFSICVAYWEFTSRRLERNDDAITNFCEGIVMIRGSAAVVLSTRTWIHAGPTRPLLGVIGIGTKPLPDHCSKYFGTLASYFQNTFRDETHANGRAHCLEALHRLQDTYERTFGSDLSCEYNLTMKWLVDMSPEFMQMLQDRCHGALAVAAMYTPLMQDFYRNWFFANWSTWLFHDIMVEISAEEALSEMLNNAHNDLSAFFYDAHKDYNGVPAHSPY